MRDVQTLQQLPGGNSKLATLSLQRATRNLQLSQNIRIAFTFCIVRSHNTCPSRQLPVAVAQLMLMNCCCLPSPPFPLVAPPSSSLLWRVASRLANIFLNLPSSLFRFDQLDRPYLIAATCRHVVCLKDITIPDLCVCSGHKSSSSSDSVPAPTATRSCLAQPLSMHKSTDATRVIESRQQAVRHTDRQ